MISFASWLLVDTVALAAAQSWEKMDKDSSTAQTMYRFKHSHQHSSRKPFGSVGAERDRDWSAYKVPVDIVPLNPSSSELG